MMLILASASPARKALLAAAGLRFESRPAHIDERAEEAALLGTSPEEVALHLASAKAAAVSRSMPDALVIGADQTLWFDDERLHKPGNHDDARDQLDRLRGRRHQLTSAATLVRTGTVIWSHADTASLTMRSFSALERDAVLAEEGDRAFESVGGYRLEGPSIRLFETIEGDYFTILGLPLLPLLAALRLHAPQCLKGFT